MSPPMGRGARVALLFLAPPAVAALVLTAAGVAAERSLEAATLLPVLLVFGYLVAALPSAIFAVAMEVAYARGVDPASRRAVWLAAGLGLLCGGAIALFLGPRKAAEHAALFAPLGAGAGAIVGALVRMRSRRAKRP